MQGVDLLTSPFAGATHWGHALTCTPLCREVDGAYAGIFVARGLDDIAAVTPVVVEVWMSSWWNDRGHVESGDHSFASLTMHGHVHHVDRVSIVVGAPVAPRLA
jgi:hypothetical protein